MMLPSRMAYWLPIILALACWPMWERIAFNLKVDIVGIIGLLPGVIALALLRRTRTSSIPYPLALPTLLLLLYTAVYHATLPLAHEMLAMTAIAALVSALLLGRRLHLALWGLLLLSLPVIPSLQFFLGYPLRAIVAQLVAPMLRATGYGVLPEGACLRWGVDLIAIDAPCSGVKMLWSGLFLACALAMYLRLPPGRTIIVNVCALVFVIAGNALRASALFYPEARVLNLPSWGHTGIGLIIFCAIAFGIACLAFRLAHQAPEPTQLPPNVSRFWLIAFLSITVLAALGPLWHPTVPPRRTDTFQGWPKVFEGRRLQRVPLSERERTFQEGFPGDIARFTDGRREYVIRWVTRDTRMLHPASNCFQAMGYRIEPQPLFVDARGRHWGAFIGKSRWRTVRVRELIYDEEGHHWSDVSAWYWSAALGRTSGPWWAVTVVGY